MIDDFRTVGIDQDAAADLFVILANRDHRLPTMIDSQTGPAHWVGELPDRVAADSIVNRLAYRSRTINLGQIDMRKLRHDQTRTTGGPTGSRPGQRPRGWAQPGAATNRPYAPRTHRERVSVT